MNACDACEPTHNQDVREHGRCWCPCHGARRVPDADLWERAPYPPTR